MLERPEAPTNVVEDAPSRVTDTEVPEYIKDQIINDLWDRVSDLGLIHDPIFMRAD